MNRKLRGIYFSPTGNTKKVVAKVCESMGGAQLTDITCESARQDTRVFGDDEALVVGVPVYAGRVPACVVEALHNLKGNETPAILVATYGNRDYDDALVELCDMLTGSGFIPVAGGAFVGVHSYSLNVGNGRPDAEDMKVIDEFGKRAAAVADGVLSGLELRLTGNRPYREGMADSVLSPVTTDRCIKCRQCIVSCPVLAIDSNPKVTDGTKCIMCQACIRVCPVGARVMDSPDFDKTVKWLEDNFSSVRKSPDVFLAENKGAVTTNG